MPEPVTADSLTPALRRSLQALRRPVTDAARTFGAVRERLTELAPRVMRLFNQIGAEHDGFTFVDFCRLFDGTVPTHAADRNGVTGYRGHRVYYTLDYMRRLVRGAGQRRGQQGVRDSATDALARTIATILQIVADPSPVWNAVQAEFAFTERVMTRLRRRVERTQPLITLRAARPLQPGNVIHMERTAAEPEQAQPQAAPEPVRRRRAA